MLLNTIAAVGTLSGMDKQWASLTFGLFVLIATFVLGIIPVLGWQGKQRACRLGAIEYLKLYGQIEIVLAREKLTNEIFMEIRKDMQRNTELTPNIYAKFGYQEQEKEEKTNQVHPVSIA